MDGKNEYTGILYEERGRGILAQRGEKVVIAANGDQLRRRLDRRPKEADRRRSSPMTGTITSSSPAATS